MSEIVEKNKHSIANMGRNCFDITEFTLTYPDFLIENCVIYAITEDKETCIFNIHKNYDVTFVGFAAVYNDKLHLMTFFIDPKYQNLKYGYSLLKYVLKFYRKLSLHVRVGNDKALKLYTNIGFNIQKTIENYYETTNVNEDAYLMEYTKPSIKFVSSYR